MEEHKTIEFSPDLKEVPNPSQRDVDTENVSINGYNNSNKQSNYWKRHLSFVLLPLLITGAPMHQMVIKINDNLRTTKEWLKSMFIPHYSKLQWFCVPINVTLIAYAIIINLVILISAFWFIKELLYDGIFPASLFNNIIDLIQIIPYLISINYLWLKGYQFRKLIESFDRDFEIIDKKNINLNHTSKLVLLYILIIFIEVTLTLISGKRNDYCDNSHDILINKTGQINNTGSNILCQKTSTSDLLSHLIVDTSFNLMIMLYIVIAWAIKSEFEAINAYIKSITGIEVPSANHFEIIKHLYKKTAKQVVRVNNGFSLLISWIIVLNLLHILIELFDGMTLLLKDEMAINGTTISISDETKRISVRMVTGIIFAIMAKLILIIIIMIQLIYVNDESKSTIVFLNDFVTQFKEKVSAADYYSFKLLKSYIISFMQQRNKRSLLTIAIFEFIPLINNRIYNYLPD